MSADQKKRNRGCKPEGEPVATTAEIPLGSGRMYEFAELIITQPAEGSFRGFSPICPHQGCLIDVFEERQMICTCHGGAFSIEDGKRISGPSKRPAEARDIVVIDGQIYHATCRRKARR